MRDPIQLAKGVVPVSLKARTRYLLSPSSDDLWDRYRGKQKAIVALAADYGNLGDIAIAYAQEKFLGSCLPQHEIVDFPISLTFTRIKGLKRVVTPDDIITIVGGGNMGDMHRTIEDCRRFIIHSFPKNRVISFPQTFDFSNSAVGRRELRKTIRTYSRHTDLHLFARESSSYNVMKDVFQGCSVDLVPDIVLFLNNVSDVYTRRGVMICLRKDDESIMSRDTRTAFAQTIAAHVTSVSEVDTHLGKNGLSIQEREREFLNILESFRRAELVITDRLHGMIFSVITGTPCLVLQNRNHKIRSTYETWLRPLEHIKLLEDPAVDTALSAIEILKSRKCMPVAMPDFAKPFEVLKRAVVSL